MGGVRVGQDRPAGEAVTEAPAFVAAYAQFYDLLYQDKDYEAESDLIEAAWREFGPDLPRTVLDLGCGTGGHALPLARRGYQVTGADASQAMLNVAASKAASANLSVGWHCSPMQDFALNQQFDAVTCMFNAINYVLEESDLARTLRNVHRQLRPNGLFVFDYRNGLAVLEGVEPTRVKWVEMPPRRLLRISNTTVDQMAQLFHTTYTNVLIEGDRIVEQAVDDHLVRFFFPREVRYQLTEAGFELLRSTGFPDTSRAATQHDFNVMVVARKV